jgi:hypothetical protein
VGIESTEIVRVLGNWVVASALGATLGVAMLVLTKLGVGMFTPETLGIGAMRAVAMMMAGLALGFAGLLAYFLYVQAGLVPFGLGMVAGFLIPTTIALFRMR